MLKTEAFRKIGYAIAFYAACCVLQTLWRFWMLRPLILLTVAPVSPAFLLLLMGFVGMILNYFDREPFDLREKNRKVFAAIFNMFARFYNGYEVQGLENLPKGKGCLLVYYHGPLPLEVIYLNTLSYAATGVEIGGVVDQFMKDIPLMSEACKIGGYTWGGREELVDLLRKGKRLTVAPGGVYEAIFSQYYKLQWRNRAGFAQVAKTADVPIVPMFTKNTCEYASIITGLLPGKIGEIAEALYLKTRLPLVLPFGGLPVKLTTFLGKPLYCAEGESAEDFAKRANESLENLINKHQRTPGSIFNALMERFGKIKA